VTGRLANRRIRLLLAVFALVFAVTLLRAFWLQGVRAQTLARMAANQHRQTVTLAANRGTIYDSAGVQLAIGEQAITVYADPLQIQDPTEVAPVVARVLRLDAKQVYEKLADRAHGFVYIERKADPARAAKLQAKHLTGLGFYPEERRFYPQHAIASQVLGYAGVDNHGLSGLELAGMFLKYAFRIQIVNARLNHNIQGTAEAVLRQTVQKWHAKDATAVVLDPRTGAVLAMAVAPTYDGNSFPSVPKDLQRNRAVTDTYEPGSTFKLVTVAGALSTGIVTPRTRFTLPYSIQVADRTIHDAEPRGTETMSVAQILARSSNVGAITLARLLGQERLMSWIGRFGYGRPTGIDYPGESQGIVLPADRWSGSTIGNVPIGQGIAVTPIQMASAYAAIANGGLWTRPHLVQRLGAGLIRPPVRRRIVSPWIARELTSMLQNVVLDGTGTLARIPGYHVAGKTGTAAKPDPHGGYSTSRYVASFVGFAPATRPRAVVLVTVDEPHGAIWGGVVAAPAFKAIMQQTLQYLSAPPDAATSSP
jgi:cell division protein FtsI/penicillin-binding protein 2